MQNHYAVTSQPQSPNITTAIPQHHPRRESCRGSGNAQQSSGGDTSKALAALKECGSRDSVNANLDLWVAHASCEWSERNVHVPPAQAVKELTLVFLKVLGMQQ